MKSKLSSICDYRKDKIEVSALTPRTYISTENMLPNRGGIALAASLPTTTQTQAFFKGDVLVSNIRPYFKKIWHATFDGGCSNDVLVFTAKPGVQDTFLYYVLSDDAFFDYSMATSKGTKMPRGDKTAIMNYEVSSFEEAEQKSIANILRSLDDKIELNNRINELLFQQALALFEYTFISQNDNDKELPLYDFAEYINGAAFKPDELGDTGLPVIKIAELKAGVTDSTRFFSGNKGEKYLVFNKDILFSWSGNPETSIDVFIWADGDGILNQHTFIVKSKFNCPWFTFLMLKHYKPEFTHIASNKQTTGLGHVTAADLKRLTFPFNLVKMQSFEEAIAPTMDLFYANLLENKQLFQLRSALLPKLMSGELDVSEIDL